MPRPSVMTFYERIMFVLARADVNIPEVLIWLLGVLGVAMMLWGGVAFMRRKSAVSQTSRPPATVGIRRHRPELTRVNLDLLDWEFKRRGSEGDDVKDLNMYKGLPRIMWARVEFSNTPATTVIDGLDLEIVGRGRVPALDWEPKQVMDGDPNPRFEIPRKIAAGRHEVRLVASYEGKERVFKSRMVTFPKL